jgi:catechol 2,3-dioxygenase-like lactoylglutathione lyase family enzyme
MPGVNRFICSMNQAAPRHRVSSRTSAGRSKDSDHVVWRAHEREEAIEFYTNALGFDVIEDTDLGDGKRWVLVAPSNSTGTCLLLARAATPHQVSRIGDRTGRRVFLFLHTDDCCRDYHAMRSRGVAFEAEPRQESYGIVAVFGDPYGNR